MNILVDENIPLMTVTALRQLGHDVKDIRGTDPQGLHDEELWTLALAEERVLLPPIGFYDAATTGTQASW